MLYSSTTLKQTIMKNFVLIKNYCLVFVIACVFSLSGCDEHGVNTPGEDHGHLKQTKTYSSDVVKQWLDAQTSMLYVQSGNPFGLNSARYMAYCGVALYESVVPGMPGYQTLYGQLTDMPAMPTSVPGYAYHWPTCANAALATMTRKLFSTTTPAGFYETVAATVDNLEIELNDQYKTEVDVAIFERSTEFGKEVANRIFEWSTKDKANWPVAPYQLPPHVPGQWQPEMPGGPIGFPYWGYNRLMVQGSLDNTVSPEPPPYSSDPTSLYYAQMKEVYDVSQSLTQEQKLIAKYYEDANPGLPAGAHYVSILKLALEQFNPALDKAAVTYAKTGISLFDATTGSFKAKFQFLRERPFSFIRTVIAPVADPANQWKPFIGTPPFPDFPSNHAVFSSSVAYSLASLYGNNTPLVNSTYEFRTFDFGNGPVSLGSRHYASFDAMTQEIAISRLYGGIHYRYSCEEGMKQGKKIAQNIHSKLKFLK
jgi:hypothetical protein